MRWRRSSATTTCSATSAACCAASAGSVHIQLLEPIPSQGLDRTELARQAQQAVRLALFGTAAPTETRRAA